MLIEWFGFFIAIGILLIGSKKHLGFSLIGAGVVLGLFTLNPEEVVNQIIKTLKTPSVLVLTAALTMIPIIGGVLQESGELDHIVNNLRIGRKPFLGFSPALLGLLPIPGGALFSAPLIDKAGEDLAGHVKAGINIWFRHILFFIYPLAPALIIPAKIANIEVYTIIKYQFPFFLLTIGLGYIFLLRKSDGDMSYGSQFSLNELLPPLTVILLAPVLDFSLQRIFNFSVTEISTFIGISTSLIMAIYIIDSRKKVLKLSIKEMKPWNFTILMFGIFIFINIFKASGIGGLIADLSLSKLALSIGTGFLLGLATGRINLPASIIIPIYLTSFGVERLPPLIFSLIFLSVFMGYVITPIHPCVGISLEFFDANMEDFLKLMAPPVSIGLVAGIVAFYLFF